MKRVWHIIKPFLAGILVIVGLLALILVPFFQSKGEVPSQFLPLQGAARNVTQSEQTTVGPLPGDMSLYESEQACQEGLSTPGYSSGMNAAEQADAARTNIYPCADFLGSMTEPNIVYTYKAEGYYPQVQYVNSTSPNAMYIVGGTSTNSTGPILPGPFISRINPISGEEVWRTYMENGNTENVFMGGTNLNVLDSGNIVFAWNHKIALLDPKDGAIIKERNLPSLGPVSDRSINYKEVTVAPDGTLIVRSQNRPENCNQQGGGGLTGCTDSAGGPEMKPSPMLAINPDTLEIYDELVMPEDSATPTIITTYQDKIAIYTAMIAHAYRVFWDPVTLTLSLDTSWEPSYLAEGQSVGDAPTLMGNWIVIQTNGVGSSTKASSIVAINVDDANNQQSVFPFGQLESGQKSFAPPKPQGDLENNMVYSADGGVGKIAGIHLDQTTGKMTTKWVVDDVSFEFQPNFGSPEHRIVVTSEHNPDADLNSLLTASYTSRAVWRDAATGKILAASDWLPPISFNSLVTPLYGGRFAYVSGPAGAIYFLQPMPKSSQPPVATKVESSPAASPAG